MVRHLRRWRDLVDQLGYRPGQILAYLDRLAAHRLACVDPAGQWRATHLGRRDRAAALLGAAGVLAGRIKRHRLERAAWSWWQEELTWRRATPHQRLRTPGPDQPPLPDLLTLPARRHGPHPARNGRADYTAALHHLRVAAHTDRRAG